MSTKNTVGIYTLGCKVNQYESRAIAEELHFTDEHYFSYMFKERVGISPLKYRSGENN